MLPIRLYLYAGAVAVLLAGGLLAHHFVWKSGHDACEAEWKARWEARDLAEIRATDAALIRQRAETDAIAKHNQEISDALAAKTADADAARRDAALARRLLAAAAGHPAPGGGALPETAGQPGTAPASGAQGDGSAGPLPGLVAAAFTECRANADRLDALNAQLTPQL